MTLTDAGLAFAPEALRVPVSILCVFNDRNVLASCLEASVATGLQLAPQTELIALDNCERAYPTAGDALNEGVRRARNEVVACVHQDVFLHSLPALERAAAVLVNSPDIGVLGAVGIDREERIVGRIRDRVVLIGDSAPTPRNIETLDEVIFLARRDQLRESPIINHPTLAWHAYAVEYSLRTRREGKRAVSLDIPLTHNSVSTNMRHLDLAHSWVGATYPEFLPIHTTCGTIHKEGYRAKLELLPRKARNLQRWWRESQIVGRIARRVLPEVTTLADIRFLIDAIAKSGEKNSIRVVDVSDDRTVPDAVFLERFGRTYSAASASINEARKMMDQVGQDEVLLVTSLSPSVAEAFRSPYSALGVVGYAEATGGWLLVGVPPRLLKGLWNRWRNRPLGLASIMRRPAADERRRGGSRL